MVTNATDVDPRLLVYLAVVMEIAATQELTQGQRGSVLNLNIVFAIVAIFFVGLRFWARFKRITLNYASDDWLMIEYLVVLIGRLIILIESNTEKTSAFMSDNSSDLIWTVLESTRERLH